MKGSYFDGPEWHALLADSIACGGLLPEREGEGSWALFRRGPFLAAYPCFPMGWKVAPAGLPVLGCRDIERLKSAGVDLLRLSAPGQGLPADIRGADLPETTLQDLQQWDADALGAGMARKFAAGRKSGLRFEPVEDSDGPLLHRLYRRTLARRGGSVRYPLSYFEGICRIPDGPLHARKVLDAEDSAVGFMVYVLDGTAGIYLHGGYAESASRARPGYFAMRSALEHCRSLGAQEFHFLVSPANQPSLVQFKESFGGKTTMRRHWDQPLTMMGRAAAAVLRLSRE